MPVRSHQAFISCHESGAAPIPAACVRPISTSLCVIWGAGFGGIDGANPSFFSLSMRLIGGGGRDWLLPVVGGSSGFGLALSQARCRTNRLS